MKARFGLALAVMMALALALVARAAGARFEALQIVIIDVPTLRLDHRDDWRRLQETVERIAPRLVVLAPLLRLHGVDENAVADVAPIFDPDGENRPARFGPAGYGSFRW